MKKRQKGRAAIRRITTDSVKRTLYDVFLLADSRHLETCVPLKAVILHYCNFVF